VIPREPGHCKGSELEWFSKTACSVWMTLCDIISKQVKYYVDFQSKI